MFGFLRVFFTKGHEVTPGDPRPPADERAHAVTPKTATDASGMDDAGQSGKSIAPVASRSNAESPTAADGTMRKYFVTLQTFQEAISKRDFETAARYVRENLAQIPAFVKSAIREWGSFDIGSIPAFERGGTILALLGDEQGLKSMRETVSAVPQLQSWAPLVDQHDEDMRLFRSIADVVTRNPGCLQTAMSGLLGVDDGRHVANLISWLEKAGKFQRTKKGGTFTLQIPTPGSSTVPTAARRISSNRSGREPLQCREIDLARLPYVPLPRAPMRWDQTVYPHPRRMAAATDLFEIRDAGGWDLLSVEKIPQAERPDPAFRRIHPTRGGLIMLDDLGNSVNCGTAPAAALRYGRDGGRLAERSFDHDVYRIGVNALGPGMIAMSQECVLHAYNDELERILEEPLLDFPEVLALQRRFGIEDERLKNRLRCVALAHDASRYLVTGVDEAWCIDATGRGLWGLRLPIKEGWSRVSVPSVNVGSSAEVMRSLEVMNLTLPFSTEELKHRYRELAKQWHPDVNPGNANATEHMKAISEAAEILTGIDRSTLERYVGERFAQEYSRQQFTVGGVDMTLSIGIEMSGVFAADWIYAANFAGRTHDVFLAGYSGKVVQVSGDGIPVRAYDIGSIPIRIIDTGDYLYLLADTRLYVLREDSLVTIVDTLGGGDLIVAQTGFGLLEDKSFQWFREDGTRLGAIVAKNPLRRVYYSPHGMVVETRQHRAVVGGVSSWWE